MKQFRFVGLLAFSLAIFGVVWLSAAPSISEVAINPAVIGVGEPTTVTLTARISDPTLLATSVNLLRVDAAGNTIANLGQMFDNGSNGDSVASDKLFTRTILLNESQPGELYFRVSAAFKGMLRRAISNSATIRVWRPVGTDEMSLLAPPDMNIQTLTEMVSGVPVPVINMYSVSQSYEEGHVSISLVDLSSPVTNLDDLEIGEESVPVSRRQIELGHRSWLVLEEVAPDGFVRSYYHLPTPTKLLSVSSSGMAATTAYRATLEQVIDSLTLQ